MTIIATLTDLYSEEFSFICQQPKDEKKNYRCLKIKSVFTSEVWHKES